jgi:peptidylprolyl isomerase
MIGRVARREQAAIDGLPMPESKAARAPRAPRQRPHRLPCRRGVRLPVGRHGGATPAMRAALRATPDATVAHNRRSSPPDVPVMRLLVSALLAALAVTAAAAEPSRPARTTQQVLAEAKPGDWRALDPENTLYLDLAAGRVVIELAPAFAPLHAANIRNLVRQRYFDGLAILRVQDNFVTQWGDPDSETADKARSLGKAERRIAAEFTRASEGLPFDVLPDGDVYAPQAGFSNGLAAARDPAAKRAWLAHCYGVVGAGRDNDPESGSGAELYVVIGHAPRQLDRNIAVVGRVVEGMEWLAALPRGTGPLGFYEKPEQRLAIRSVRLAADLPENQRLPLEALRTDTATFQALIESRRNRRDDWYQVPAGKIDLCNIPLPVRRRPDPA